LVEVDYLNQEVLLYKVLVACVVGSTKARKEFHEEVYVVTLDEQALALAKGSEVAEVQAYGNPELEHVAVGVGAMAD